MESIPGDRALKSSRELLRGPLGKNTSDPPNWGRADRRMPGAHVIAFREARHGGQQ
jgi:hypothetical protein